MEFLKPTLQLSEAILLCPVPKVCFLYRAECITEYFGFSSGKGLIQALHLAPAVLGNRTEKKEVH